MTANAPIDFKGLVDQFISSKWYRSELENAFRSIAERVEAQAIERCYRELETPKSSVEVSRLCGPKSDKEEGK